MQCNGNGIGVVLDQLTLLSDRFSVSFWLCDTLTCQRHANWQRKVKWYSICSIIRFFIWLFVLYTIYIYIYMKHQFLKSSAENTFGGRSDIRYAGCDSASWINLKTSLLFKFDKSLSGFLYFRKLTLCDNEINTISYLIFEY